METHSHDEAQQVSLDTAAGLSYDYLKQLGTIAMTAAGGLIALVQFVEGDRRFFVKIMIATSMMFLAALLAFLAQYSLVDRLRQAHRLLRRASVLRYPTQPFLYDSDRALGIGRVQRIRHDGPAEQIEHGLETDVARIHAAASLAHSPRRHKL